LEITMNRARVALFLAVLAAGAAASLLAASPVVHAGQPALDSPADERGSRLLFVIAAICVFGVSTAVIRAIIAQRTNVQVT
jgi:hypothetical protein